MPRVYFRLCAFRISLLTLFLVQLGSQAIAATGFDHDANGNLTSVRAAVAGLPVIETHPRSFWTEDGAGGMSVAVTSSTPVTYQWKRADGTDIAGATSDTLFFPQILPALEGLYYVVITNATGSVNSTMEGLNRLPQPMATSTSGFSGQPAMTLGGTVMWNLGSIIAERGFVYAVRATDTIPEIGGTGVTKLAASGTELGSFSAVATGLAPGTTYSYRSYATNSAGTNYSAVSTFTTAAFGTVAGELDTDYNPNANDEINTITVQADGKVLIGGGFTRVGGVTRNHIARLVNDPAMQNLTIPDATRVLWSRSGSAPELGDVVFEQSLDNGATWSLLGAGERVAGTAHWAVTGLN